MSVMEPTAGIRLPQPEEPIDLGASLRHAVLGGADWRQGFSDDICIGIVLWDHWRAALEPAGMDRETFIDIVVGYRRELWFWLSGDRQWEQYVAGLAGRVARRLPAG
ncbi:MAG: hypothetical protein ACYDD6_01145 [Acidimicrobiales bacterium]